MAKGQLVKVEKDYGFIIFWWALSLFTTITSLFLVSILRNTTLSKLLSQWDGTYYRDLVARGYISNVPMKDGKIIANVNAFFPVFPTLVRAVDSILPGGSFFAFMLVNLSASLATLFVFFQCAKLLLDDTKAKNATILFAVFPSAFIFFWFYSESISALFLVSALYFFLKHRIVVSSLIFGIAAATRPNAIFLCLAPALFVAFTFLRNNRIEFTFEYLKNLFIAGIKSLALAIISISGFIAFMLFLDNKTGISKVWFRIQNEGWGQTTTPFVSLKIYTDALFKFNIFVQLILVISGIIFCLIVYYLIFKHKGDHKILLTIFTVISTCLLAGFVTFSDESTARLIIIVLSGLIYFFIVCVIFRQLHIEKYSALSLALYLPPLVLIFLAMSNGSAVASLRFVLTASPIYIALASYIPNKTIKYVVPISLAALFGLCFFHAWGLYEPFMVGSP